LETPSNSLRNKNIEVVLIDGLIILTTLFADKLKIWQRFEGAGNPIDEYAYEGYKVPGFMWLYLFVVLITMLYAGARKSIPKNQFFELIYGIGLIGVLLLFPGIIALTFNSIVIGIPALLVGYVLLMKQDIFLGFANKLYDHSSRIIVLPLLTYLFISGAEHILSTRIDFQYAGICILMTYMPIRLLLAFKEPYKFYHFLIIMATMAFYTVQTYRQLENSPTTPVWATMSGYLGDKVQVIKETDNKALILQNGNTVFIVSKKSNSKWEIDTSLTNHFEKDYDGNFSKWP